MAQKMIRSQRHSLLLNYHIPGSRLWYEFCTASFDGHRHSQLGLRSACLPYYRFIWSTKLAARHLPILEHHPFLDWLLFLVSGQIESENSDGHYGNVSL